MKSVYVIMKQKWSPVEITPAVPHKVCFDRHQAKKIVRELTQSAIHNKYWFERVSIVDSD